MDTKGFESLKEALSSDEKIEEFGVAPEPAEGEDLPEVSVTVATNQMKLVYKALRKARLLRSKAHEFDDTEPSPQLLFSWCVLSHDRTAVNIHFEDLKATATQPITPARRSE